MLIEAFAIWPNKGQAKLAIAGSNLTGVDNFLASTGWMVHTWLWRAHSGVFTIDM